MARTSASSSTRRGRMDTVRHRKSRCAYSRFSSSMLSNIRLYDSSNVFGKSFKTFRILEGNVRSSRSAWWTTHLNLQDHVSVHRHDQGMGRDMKWLTCHPHSQTAHRRQVVCPPLSISVRSGQNRK